MRIAVVMPVGPGHTGTVQVAVDSVLAADLPSGWSVDPIVVMDDRAELGRSKARNVGAEEAGDVDWLFWLDSDDSLTPQAFRILERELHKSPDLEALWGPIFQKYTLWGPGKIALAVREMRFGGCQGPIETFDDLVGFGPAYCIHSGCFVKKTLHDTVGGFLEAIDFGEDTEYAWACAAHSKRFRKVVEDPIFLICSDNPSATGRRGLDADEIRERSASSTNIRRGMAVWNYWKARGKVRWTAEELQNREHLYGDIGPPWKDEPYRYKPYPSE